MSGTWKKGLEFVKPAFYIWGAMTRVRPYILVAVGLGLVMTVLAAAIIRQRPTATPTANGIVVEWTTDDESGVAQFLIMRSASNGDLVEIARIAPMGSGSTYKYTDQSVFKIQDRVFKYKIRVLLTQGGSLDSEETLPSRSISSTAKQTWGSIKAMFR
jgi:hypothetical protein